jgi:hypothetical protein
VDISVDRTISGYGIGNIVVIVLTLSDVACTTGDVSTNVGETGVIVSKEVTLSEAI